MTTKKASEKQIKNKVIEDGKEPNAWGKPIAVPASRSPRPVKLNTRVRPKSGQNSESFLRVARSLNLDGPPNWSSHIDDNLYDGTKTTDE